MIVNLEKCDKLESTIKNCVNLSYDREKQLFTLSFTQGGYGRTNRSVSFLLSMHKYRHYLLIMPIFLMIF